MKTKLSFILSLVLLAIGFYSCTKAGTGGNAAVICNIINSANHDTLTDLVVYIKYGQSTAPSNNTSGYNTSKEANPRSTSVTFTGLNEGNYYFYVTGNDSTYSKNVPMKGGGSVHILHANRNSNTTTNISVSY